MTTDTKELKYEPSDMALMLEIKESTLRKYSLLLEKEGYTFHKGSVGRRWYSDSDLMVLRRFMELKNGDMSLETACHAVVAWAKGRNIAPSVMENANDLRDSERYLLDKLEKQNELIQELFARLDRQEEFFKQRDEWLIEKLKEQNEKPKLQLESETNSEQKPKPTFLSKLFGHR
ncbi:hypothetical protein HBHAL_7002 (plasmid) [Halobacillus halophilus DSM 2266]|uniref:HTH merR-type domain-containing protein n=1 Tax=Halobacillus halophilus (strain ATCC 35676 / DSM 2266 / JCM 20832 / KCTC 3685 / LMG 17431 / NBRC 102448 / NCIMB 2269) TaxID=866895 RepID=I0JTP8_HALH3|nr:helix-turn-helix domain-containing protein [Halobacillus halophilus]CCG47521.1 hypothetical protein HBHAL_7002 [Halobacillus halophilus DSM 2266]